jgi:biopolymer transport protein ExbB
VLAYNWLVRRNKNIMEDLGAFTNDVNGYLASGGKVKPRFGGTATKTSAPVGRATGTTQQSGEPLRTGMTSTGTQSTKPPSGDR